MKKSVIGSFKPYKGNVQIANTLLFFGLFYLFEQIYYT